LINFCPETLFESFLCGFEGCGFFYEVKVGEDTNDFGEAMGLENIQELECLLQRIQRFLSMREDSVYHFEAKRAVDHKEDEICNFTNVNHAINIVGTFYECQSSFPPTDNCDRTLGFTEGLLRIPANEAFQESGFPDARGAYDSHDDWGGIFIWCTVDKGNVKTSLALFCSTTALSVRSPPRFRSKCLAHGMRSAE